MTNERKPNSATTNSNLSTPPQVPLLTFSTPKPHAFFVDNEQTLKDLIVAVIVLASWDVTMASPPQDKTPYICSDFRKSNDTTASIKGIIGQKYSVYS